MTDVHYKRAALALVGGTLCYGVLAGNVLAMMGFISLALVWSIACSVHGLWYNLHWWRHHRHIERLADDV